MYYVVYSTYIFLVRLHNIIMKHILCHLLFVYCCFFNNCDLDHRSANKTVVVVATIKSTSKLLIDKFVFDTI